MIGLKKGNNLYAGVGQLTLDKMDLDRREEFAGDAFNPFGFSAGNQINT
jgi:hypothetical protein